MYLELDAFALLLSVMQVDRVSMTLVLVKNHITFQQRRIFRFS